MIRPGRHTRCVLCARLCARLCSPPRTHRVPIYVPVRTPIVCPSAYPSRRPPPPQRRGVRITVLGRHRLPVANEGFLARESRHETPQLGAASSCVGVRRGDVCTAGWDRQQVSFLSRLYTETRKLTGLCPYDIFRARICLCDVGCAAVRMSTSGLEDAIRILRTGNG